VKSSWIWSGWKITSKSKTKNAFVVFVRCGVDRHTYRRRVQASVVLLRACVCLLTEGTCSSPPGTSHWTLCCGVCTLNSPSQCQHAIAMSVRCPGGATAPGQCIRHFKEDAYKLHFVSNQTLTSFILIAIDCTLVFSNCFLE